MRMVEYVGLVEWESWIGGERSPKTISNRPRLEETRKLFTTKTLPCHTHICWLCNWSFLWSCGVFWLNRVELFGVGCEIGRWANSSQLQPIQPTTPARMSCTHQPHSITSDTLMHIYVHSTDSTECTMFVVVWVVSQWWLDGVDWPLSWDVWLGAWSNRSHTSRRLPSRNKILITDYLSPWWQLNLIRFVVNGWHNFKLRLLIKSRYTHPSLLHPIIITSCRLLPPLHPLKRSLTLSCRTKIICCKSCKTNKRWENKERSGIERWVQHYCSRQSIKSDLIGRSLSLSSSPPFWLHSFNIPPLVSFSLLDRSWAISWQFWLISPRSRVTFKLF